MNFIKMEKKYVPYKSYTDENLRNAIKAVQEKRTPLRDAAKRNGIPTSYEKAGMPCLLSATKKTLLLNILT
ncbi:hypothetical protein NQ314_017258 [Rhamnusium bicolor]|uniref:Uncharacterized protein n=1 Tax=Rhamnusium bicolor TaxID=1586634 RepID=A0AAV8WUE0_9CUCU|nr:hypothetical protein NQ314_017258 [Rhamnusium bicolor]